MTSQVLTAVESGFYHSTLLTWATANPTGFGGGGSRHTAGYRFDLSQDARPCIGSATFTVTLDSTRSLSTGADYALTVLVYHTVTSSGLVTLSPYPLYTNFDATDVVIGDEVSGFPGWWYASTVSSTINGGDTISVPLCPTYTGAFGVTTQDPAFSHLAASTGRKYLPIWTDNDWRGIFIVALVPGIPSAGAANLGLSNASLTVDWSPNFSGLAGYGREHGRVRAVRDSRYGLPALSSQLVRDGYNEGLWVFPWDRDEEDPPNRYRPNPREGGKDDQIPS